MKQSGGIVKDRQGHFRCDFVAEGGVFCRERAEFWAVKIGLNVAWYKGYKKLTLKVASSHPVKGGRHRNRLNEPLG